MNSSSGWMVPSLEVSSFPSTNSSMTPMRAPVWSFFYIKYLNDVLGPNALERRELVQ